MAKDLTPDEWFIAYGLAIDGKYNGTTGPFRHYADERLDLMLGEIWVALGEKDALPPHVRENSLSGAGKQRPFTPGVEEWLEIWAANDRRAYERPSKPDP